MCKKRKIDIARFQNLTHVKILAKRFSNIENCSVGVFKDGIIYNFEQAGTRDYICFTYYNGEVWTWQQ